MALYNKMYARVIPRDLFNESKLLKCMGMLCMKISDRMAPVTMTYQHFEPNQGFTIAQLEGDAGLIVTNIVIRIQGQIHTFKSIYNSTRAWPLLCEGKDGDEYSVFDDDGHLFDEKFIEYCEKLVPEAKKV